MVKIIFVHPDLGIGGAERLVIDAALALKKKGHETSFITAHHDPHHCFPETINGQLNVLCIGDWLPRSSFGYLYAFWAYIRMIYISIYIALISDITYDVAFVDQISACIPFLKLKQKIKIIFYCHYPDQLLTDRKSLLKIMYRKVIDKVEELTTNMADTILVNSKFTSKVFKETFKSIKTNPSILYPSIDFSKFNKPAVSLPPEVKVSRNTLTFLSLNRYERKKNVALAIRALKIVLDDLEEKYKDSVVLVIAGGYDHRVLENVEYYSELVKLSEELKVENQIKFLKSPSDEIKQALFMEACCLLYTPDKEHFGIVPIESMYMGTPVIAVNNGGPVETIIVGKTGFLRDQTPEAFAEPMKSFVDKTLSKDKMSKNCHSHVIKKFSYDNFATQLDYFVQSLVDSRKKS